MNERHRQTSDSPQPPNDPTFTGWWDEQSYGDFHMFEADSEVETWTDSKPHDL